MQKLKQFTLKLSLSVRNFLAREDGATMVEYALMVALIAIVALVGVSAMGVSIGGMFTSTAAKIK